MNLQRVKVLIKYYGVKKLFFMKKGNIIAIILLILSVCGLCLFLVFPIVSSIMFAVSVSSMSSSVGIIGGADGPTAVLVSSSLYGDIFYFVGATVCAAVFVASIIYLVRNSRK